MMSCSDQGDSAHLLQMVLRSYSPLRYYYLCHYLWSDLGFSNLLFFIVFFGYRQLTHHVFKILDIAARTLGFFHMQALTL